MTRGSPARLEITPALLAAMFAAGRPKLARLKTLKTSRRKVVLMRLLKSIRRWTLMSNVIHPGPRRMLRPALPNMPDGTWVNAAGLNHCCTVPAPLGSPVRFGMPV